MKEKQKKLMENIFGRLSASATIRHLLGHFRGFAEGLDEPSSSSSKEIPKLKYYSEKN